MENAQSEAKTCGNCAFAKANGTDLASVVCFGNPPTPVMMGGRQVGMRMEYDIQCLRPAIPRSSPPCSLHKPAAPLILIGAGQ